MSTNKPAPIADYGTLAAFNVAFDMVKRANAGMDRAGIPAAVDRTPCSRCGHEMAMHRTHFIDGRAHTSCCHADHGCDMPPCFYPPLAASPVACATPTIADDVHQLRELAPMVDEEHRRRRELRTAATDDLYAACRAALRWLPPGAAHDLVVAALEKADGVR